MIFQPFAFLFAYHVSAQLGEIIQYDQMRLSECQDFISTCPPIKTSCASMVCGQCYGIGDATFKSCCNEAQQANCFQTAFGAGNNNGGGNPYVTTTAADPNYAGCQSAFAILSACESATPNFDNLDGITQASCLCYDATSAWVPNAFDQPWSSCVAWASTADTTDLAGLLSGAGLCQSAGNVLAGTAAASMPATTTSRGLGSTAAITGTTKGSTVIGSTSTPTTSALKPTTSSSGGVERGRFGSGNLMGLQLALGLLVCLLP